MFKILTVGVAALFLMSGCLSSKSPVTETVTSVAPDQTVTTIVTDHTDKSYYHKAVVEHSSNESRRISEQAEAIALTVTESDVSSDAKALLAYLGMERIGALKPQDYQGVAPKDWVDVADNVATQAGTMVKVITGGTVAYKGLSVLENLTEQKGTKITTGDGSQITVEQTDNEVHATGSQNTATLNPAGSSSGVATEDECPEGQIMYEKLGVCMSPESAAERDAAEAAEMQERIEEAQ